MCVGLLRQAKGSLRRFQSAFAVGLAMQFSRGVVRFGSVFMRFGCVNMRGLGHVLISLLDGLVLSQICQMRALAFMQETPSPAMGTTYILSHGYKTLSDD
jgi:hypothetical protein